MVKIIVYNICHSQMLIFVCVLLQINLLRTHVLIRALNSPKLINV